MGKKRRVTAKRPLPPVKGRMKNKALGDLLGKRGLTLENVRRMIFAGHSSLVQILRGQRKGVVTWNRLIHVLNKKEMEVAMDYANLKLKDKGWRLHLDENEEKVVCSPVPQAEGMFHVEQSEAALV